jgi:hypothetical protein
VAPSTYIYHNAVFLFKNSVAAFCGIVQDVRQKRTLLALNKTVAYTAAFSDSGLTLTILPD